MLGGDDVKAVAEMHRLDAGDMAGMLRWLGSNVAPEANAVARGVKLLSALAQTMKTTREMHVTYCATGLRIAEKLGLSRGVQDNLNHLGERWDGKGSAHGVRGRFIPIGARVVSLAEVAQDVGAAEDGPQAAQEVAQERRGKAFDPEVVDAFLELSRVPAFWEALQQEKLPEQLGGMEPQTPFSSVPEGRLDDIAAVFAEVIDMKSPFTANHSRGVALVAEGLAKRMGLPEAEVTLVRRAGLLHDMGKVSVPNSILDKKGKLTEREWERMRLHPYYSERILSRVGVLRPLATIAGAHHEWMNGGGYFRQLTGPQMTAAAHIVSIADMFQALSEDRPYRPALETEQIFQVMDKEVGSHLSPDCFAALKAML
ncbi:MAG: HD domain-containing protein [Chloroflexi bacterium]|nr:HD domain-containing protein [Chloroflexota bacterium]